MRGRTFLSLSLCIGTLILLPLSYRRKMGLEFVWGQGVSLSADSNAGVLELEWCRKYELRLPYRVSANRDIFKNDSTGRLLDTSEFQLVYHADDMHDRSQSPRFDFTLYDDVNGNYIGPTDWTRSYKLRFPHWILIIAFILLPACKLALRRQNKQLAGYCSRCNYDLRATPDRCPECGTISLSPEAK